MCVFLKKREILILNFDTHDTLGLCPFHESGYTTHAHVAADKGLGSVPVAP